MAAQKVSMDCNVLPHREKNTAVVERIKVPCNRRALFLAVENEMFRDNVSDELSFSALSLNDKATFQFLLYLTYCCKGEFLQVTLENPDFHNMSPPIREDFAHGRLFCFVLDMSEEDSCETSAQPSILHVQHASRRDRDEYLSGSQLLDSLVNMDVDLDVFRQGRSESRDAATSAAASGANQVLDEAFSAFMRLQLVRKRASSLNNVMIGMRDSKGELGSLFDWVDVCTDTLRSNKVDKKKVKELQGSLYTPTYQSGRQAVLLPRTIADLNLKALDNSIGTLTDSASDGEGKALFVSLVSKLIGKRWLKHKVVRTRYNTDVTDDVKFMKRLEAFTRALDNSSRDDEVDVRGLLVFRYSLEKVIDSENPDLFVKSLIHRHVPVTKTRIDKVLCDIKSKRRTRALATLLNDGRCYCKPRRGDAEAQQCRGDCQTAYSCFYNWSQHHPFTASSDEHSYYFARLYPHLGKLERLSKEMKVKYRGRRQFESIADMVFNILVRHHKDSLYEGLSYVIDEKMSNSSLSLSHGLTEIHESLYLAPGNRREYSEEPDALAPVKVYDHALVRYLFCDSLQVGRLFQASTTFNYIIINTAPRYTIERVMLFNITGPGEGKSYANSVLNYQFRGIRGCIETLTSFTPQAFKYKQKRNACVVMIDDAHITHEKNIRTVDRDSNVIPNTFKNLLDTSVLESDVVTRDMNSGKVDTVKYQAVHNCGFVWNSNTMGFVSEAWADRCVIMESEFPERVTRTRSTKQIQDTVEKYSMDRIAAKCLYRQNLIQSATMIAESDIMQFSERFDKARDACVAALYASHIVCTGVVSRRVSFCINQLVFAEAMKLACHFVFDVWIPPWTNIPDEREHPDLRSYMKRMNSNRLRALNKLTFGQICLEVNAVYKLCTAACLPDVCPRVVDVQGRFACEVLGYILTQIHQQNLKTTFKTGHLSIFGIDKMFFPEKQIKGGNDIAHEMLTLCSTCKVPARVGGDGGQGKANTFAARVNYKLCTYRYVTNIATSAHIRRGHSNPRKKVGSVTVPLEAVYDLLAIYAPSSHSGFWDQVSAAMVDAYQREDFEGVNAFGQCSRRDEEQPPVRRLLFTLDFNEDPVRSVILEATAGVEPLNELSFDRCMLGGETFRCSAPLYYGGVIKKAMSHNAPKDARDKRHLKEARVGARGTFHGPRLSLYSNEYSGVPVKNVSSFCTTRTVYHQDRILLTVNRDDHDHLIALKEDWEWKDATEVFNKIHGNEAFSVEMLKRDYAATMMAVKGESITARPQQSAKLCALIRALQESSGLAALAKRRSGCDTQEPRRPPVEETLTTGSLGRKRAGKQSSRDSVDARMSKRMRK